MNDRAEPAAAIDRALARLRRLHPRLIDLSLDRIDGLLARLEHPERRLPPVVHVAGTNAKGSVIAYMRAGLEAAGYRVHVYTSPHLVRFNERIRLAGREIDDAALIELLERVEQVNAGATITEFEITTAAAFAAFAETSADVLLLETGLGGRFDATNVVAAPLLTVITPISHDHEQFLGSDLAGIAAEKAGIMKPGVPCLLGPQPAAALDALRAVAAEKNAPLIEHGTHWSARRDGAALVLREGKRETALPLPALAGAHQIDNAGLAVIGLRHLDRFDIGAEAQARALTEIDWPARLQRLTRGPLVEVLPAGAELWLDGGHNPSAGAAMAAVLADWRTQDAARRPVHLILSMLKSKDAAGYLAPLAAEAPVLWPVPMAGDHDTYGVDDLAEIASGLGFEVRRADSVTAAVEAVAASGDEPRPRILIAGSLYLAGEVLAVNG